MKLEDITLETSSADVLEAIEKGDFTLAEWGAQAPRLRREREARFTGEKKAIALVKSSEKKPRTSPWHAKYLIGGDKSVFYLVQCGRVSWHVDPSTWEIRKVQHF